jgi:hypothetical protein
MLNPDREIPAHENWPCHVGSGECQTPARYVMDDGDGGDFYMCKAHYIEVKAFEAMVAGKTPEDCAFLEALIAIHE